MSPVYPRKRSEKNLDRRYTYGKKLFDKGYFLFDNIYVSHFEKGESYNDGIYKFPPCLSLRKGGYTG